MIKPFGELPREEQLALFEAWLDGAHIENLNSEGYWETGHPMWLSKFIYRVAPTKPSINWDHVHPDYNWLATDSDGDSFLYNAEPVLRAVMWTSGVRSPLLKDFLSTEAEVFVSFKAGTVNWKDSLVQRPD